MTEIPQFLQKGFKAEIGSHQFTIDDIIRYGKKYAPFNFHADKSSPNLVANGLHIASVWMSLQRTFIANATQELMDAGQTYPIFGPSPGVEYMKWPSPVFADDVVTYHNHIQEIRQSSSRPGWWVMTNRVSGQKQSGEIALEFQSSVLLTLKTNA